MTDAAHNVRSKNEWVLTQGAFDSFLRWLDQGSDSEGENYLEMRRRLVSYFDRKNCAAPDELADETMNRAARRLEEVGAITNTAPAQYCYIVAKYVFLEYLRRADRAEISLDGLSAQPVAAGNTATIAEEEDQNRIECLERCLGQLDKQNRELIVEYYRGEQSAKVRNRRELAVRLGISANALSIRACRIRDKLESCVAACLKTMRVKRSTMFCLNHMGED